MTKKDLMTNVTDATIKALQYVKDLHNHTCEAEKLHAEWCEKVDKLSNMNNAFSPEGANDPENMIAFRERRQKLVEDIANLAVKGADQTKLVKINKFGLDKATYSFVFILSDGSLYTIPVASKSDFEGGDYEFPVCIIDTLYAAANYISKVIAVYDNKYCHFCPESI